MWPAYFPDDEQAEEGPELACRGDVLDVGHRHIRFSFSLISTRSGCSAVCYRRLCTNYD